MLTQRLDEIASATRRDAVRLGIAAAALVLVLTAILGANFFPQPLRIDVGDVAAQDILAPRAIEYVSDVLTAEKLSDTFGLPLELARTDGRFTARRAR